MMKNCHGLPIRRLADLNHPDILSVQPSLNEDSMIASHGHSFFVSDDKRAIVLQEIKPDDSRLSAVATLAALETHQTAGTAC